MDITCIRDNGECPGEDILEPLLSDLNAALSRGRAELDQGALRDRQELEVVLAHHALGQIIEVNDSLLGTWRGKLVGIQHSVTVDDSGALSGSTQLTLEKPR